MINYYTRRSEELIDNSLSICKSQRRGGNIISNGNSGYHRRKRIDTIIYIEISIHPRGQYITTKKGKKGRQKELLLTNTSHCETSSTYFGYCNVPGNSLSIGLKVISRHRGEVIQVI